MKKFWNNNKGENWFIIVLLILFFPVGLYLMWRYSEWKKTPKWIVTAIVLLVVFSQSTTDTKEVTEEVAKSEEVTEEVTEESTEEKTVEESTEESTEEKTEEPVEEEPVEENKVEKEEKAKEETKKEKTPIEEIEGIITESLGGDNIAEMNVTEYEDSFEVDVTFAASENFTTGLIASDIKRNIVDTTLALKESDHYISYLLLTATLPLTDSSGNESDGQVMAASFNGDTIDELNADNEVFLYDNLENAADGFSAHPDFRE